MQRATGLARPLDFTRRRVTSEFGLHPMLIWEANFCRFYYADERDSEGAGVPLDKLSGEFAGEFYWDLAEKKQDIPWFATYVAGKGYVHFPNSSRT